MILVTGAGGSIGKHLVAHLAARRAPVRVLVRDAARYKAPDDPIDVAIGDLDHPDTLTDAFEGVTRLFLLSPGPDIAAQDAALLDAAERAGVEHVVLLSSLGAELGGIASGGPHLPGEARLRRSAAGWTILRPSEFMTNTLWWRDEILSGAIFVPAGEGRIGYIDPADIAAVAAAVLTGDGHDGATYRLTGPEALGIADVARVMGDIVGFPVRHVDLPPAAHRARMAKAGMPAPVIEMMTTYYAAVRAGEVDVVSDDVMRVTGRPARRFAEWARASATAIRRPPRRPQARRSREREAR